jgi:hypothetical protein
MNNKPKTVSYKSKNVLSHVLIEGGGFDNRWGEFLNLPNPSGHTLTAISEPIV